MIRSFAKVLLIGRMISVPIWEVFLRISKVLIRDTIDANLTFASWCNKFIVNLLRRNNYMKFTVSHFWLCHGVGLGRRIK